MIIIIKTVDDNEIKILMNLHKCFQSSRNN